MMMGMLDTSGRGRLAPLLETLGVGNGAAPESVNATAHAQVAARRLFVVALLCAACALASLLFAWTVTTRFARESRVTYVKLAPNGTWDVTANFGESVEYFDATLRTVLYDWLTRRYSMRKSTIIADWGNANAMYDAPNQRWFIDEYRAKVVAAEHASCRACPDAIIDVRTHQHLTAMPREIGARESAPLETLFYATERTIPTESIKATDERKKIFKVTWRFLSKAAIQSRPELLRWNPIGVQILGVEVTDDTN